MNIYSTFKKMLLAVIYLGFLSHLSYASVTLIGTRIIYPEEKKFVSLNFRSSDQVPSVIDTWVSNKAISSASATDAPFIITPSIFRIDPNKGQTVKLIYTGKPMVNDRESVFYFNFVQLPATEKNINKLLISYKSTVKIFYRPDDLKQSPENISSFLEIDSRKIKAGMISVINSSEYHVTPTQIQFTRKGKNVLTVDGEALSMIAPFSRLEMKIPPLNNIDEISASMSMINDLGGISTYKIKII